MIKIACNYSTALINLLVSKQTSVDYIKTGMYADFDKSYAAARPLCPILLHGLGYFEHTGMKNIDSVDFKRANNLIIKCGSPHYGLHLAIENSDIAPDMDDDGIYSVMSNNIRTFKDNLSVPLLLENIPDSPQDRTVFNHYPYTDPERISGLILDNDVGLLLDLTHAKITAMYNSWGLRGYLQSLPLDRVREIHINGSGYDESGYPADTHQAMEDEDYENLEWVLCHSRTQIVTLEYDGVKSESEEAVSSKILNQINKLRDICK